MCVVERLGLSHHTTSNPVLELINFVLLITMVPKIRFIIPAFLRIHLFNLVNSAFLQVSSAIDQNVAVSIQKSHGACAGAMAAAVPCTAGLTYHDLFDN